MGDEKDVGVEPVTEEDRGAEVPAEPSDGREVEVSASEAAEPMEAGSPTEGSDELTGTAGESSEEPAGGGFGDPAAGGAAAAPEKLLEVREVLSRLCSLLGAEAEVEVRDTAEAIACQLRLAPGRSAFDAVPTGQILEAIQHLAHRIVNRDAEGGKRIVLELEGAGESEGDPAMVGMARRLAASAKRMEKPLTIVPIHARDRKAIHVALKDDEGVKTRSEGEGLLRRLVVEPR